MAPDETPQPALPKPKIVIEFNGPESTVCMVNGSAGGLPVNPEQMLIASATLKMLYEANAAQRFMDQQQRMAAGQILVPQANNGRKVRL